MCLERSLLSLDVDSGVEFFAFLVPEASVIRSEKHSYVVETVKRI